MEVITPALEYWRSILAAESPHAVLACVLTDPRGHRCIELRRWVDSRPLLVRGPFSSVLLGLCLDESVEVEFRAVGRLPAEGAP